MSAETHPECPSCSCGRRAPVQGSPRIRRADGTIAWWEHEQAWVGYAARYGNDQTAERIAQRGGFSYGEVTDQLGHEPTTWRPR